MEKAAFDKKKILFTSKLDLNLRNKLVKCYIWSMAFMVLKLGHFRKHIRKKWGVLTCGPGGWRRSVGPTV